MMVRVGTGDGCVPAASPHRRWKVGDTVALSVRPERISLLPGDASSSDLPATVQQCVYVGDHLRLVAITAGRQVFVVKLANTASANPPEPGVAVRIAWRAEDCLALEP